MLKDCYILVVRLTGQKSLKLKVNDLLCDVKNSKPCSNCANYIQRRGITRAYYSF